jgi:hypothetical protein
MNNEVTLKSFVEENHRILSTISVLAALATLLGTLSVNWIAYLLSFSMLSALAMLWSEIKLKGSKNDNLNLVFFKFFLRIGYWLIILHILLSHRVLSWVTLFVPIWLIFLFLFLKVFKKSEETNKIFKSSINEHRIMAYIIFVIMLLTSLGLGIILSAPANTFLDMLDHYNSKINLY